MMNRDGLVNIKDRLYSKIDKNSPAGILDHQRCLCIIYRYNVSQSATTNILLMYDFVVSVSPTIPNIIRDDVTLYEGRSNQETIEIQIKRFQRRIRDKDCAKLTQ